MSRPPFLFGGSSGGQTRSQYLVEFRAGKMTQNGSTVSPVKGRKGLVYLHQSSDDSLMHFCWKDRTSGAVEDDLIIFPDEAEFKKVPQCTTGRVFVLKFKPSSRRFFYWSQEPKDDKDEDWVNKINEYINNPPAPGSRNTGSGGLSPASALADLSALPDGDLQGLLNNMSPQQLMSVLGGVGGMGSAASLASLLGAATSRSPASSTTSQVSTPAPQTPATTPAVVSAATSESNLPTSGSTGVTAATGGASGIQLSDLQSIISGLNVPKENDVNVDLSSSLTLEALQPLLTNEEFMSRVREKLPPNTETTASANTSEQFAQTVQSPQFQQALSTFSSALQSGQLGPLIQQFGFGQDCVDAANSGDMEKFVKALQKQQSKDKDKDKSGSKSDTSGKPEDKKEDKEDDMALD